MWCHSLSREFEKLQCSMARKGRMYQKRRQKELQTPEENREACYPGRLRGGNLAYQEEEAGRRSDIPEK